jgi:hypothetical protein
VARDHSLELHGALAERRPTDQRDQDEIASN